jgi:hypothetical protein
MTDRGRPTPEQVAHITTVRRLVDNTSPSLVGKRLAVAQRHAQTGQIVTSTDGVPLPDTSLYNTTVLDEAGKPIQKPRRPVFIHGLPKKAANPDRIAVVELTLGSPTRG